MNYLEPIKTAIVVFPIVAALVSIPFILHNYHKYGSINRLRTLIIYSFILYMVTIYFLVILPLPRKSSVGPQEGMIRLVPFGFVRDFISESSLVLTDASTYLKALSEPCFYTVAFNILMFIPFGMYMRYYFKCSIKKTILVSFFLSLFFEVTQLSGLYFIYPYAYRVFDVDDLIMNTLGGLIGYWCMGLVSGILPSRCEIDERSIKDSQVVSGLRRIVIFHLDIFLYMFFLSMTSLFVRIEHLPLFVFVAYYIVFPVVSDGFTAGSKFLNVRLVFEKNRLLNVAMRISFLFAYYYGSVVLSAFAAVTFVNRVHLGEAVSFYLYLSVFAFIALFYLVNGIVLLKNKTHFYDKLFHVEYKNTIEMR